jgi:hypothetical protein
MLDGTKIQWRLIGRVTRRDYLTGTWYDVAPRGYSGAFQIGLRADKQSAEGIWIGYGNDGAVNSGRLAFREVKKLAKSEQVAESSPGTQLQNS